MRLRTSFLTRCLALVLALVLVVSGSNLGAVLQVFAAGGTETKVSAGKLVADNYELTEAEKVLLRSGYLVGDTYSYTVPTDSELITVDTENTKITAQKSGNWTPTTADIVADGTTVETVNLVNGVGSYDPAVGNAFSVKVRYELTQEVDDGVQETLLNAAAWLKQGVKTTDAVSAQSGNLYILEQAMPQLVELANEGVETPLGKVNLNEDGKAAINALNAQMTANGGKLDLSIMVDEYDAGAKTGYLMTKGAQMQAEINELLVHLVIVSNALNQLSGNLQIFIENGWIDAATGTLLQTLAGSVNNLKNALDTVAQAPWTAANMGTALVNASANYAALDTLVAALGTTTEAPEVKNPLLVTETTIQKNLSMFNVTVKVVLNTVQDNEVKEYGSVSTTLTLGEGVSAEEIVAAVEAAGIVNAALNAWEGVYVDGKFDKTATGLPDSLNKNTEYTITYSPKRYDVDIEGEGKADYPFGYQLTLPMHVNPEKSYDYYLGSEYYPQGSVITVKDNMTFARDEGKAYYSTDLYSVVADNYGNDVAKAILKSGALKDNSVINVRKPDPTEAASLLELLDGQLTATEEYDASYNGLKWNPYTYGTNGTENTFGGNTAEWSGKSVKVQYILKLTNFSVAEVEAVLELAETLKAEAAAQKDTLDAFKGKKATMGQLDKVKLGALNGVIDVTDFTPGDNTDTDAANLEMRAYFKGLVSGIIANNLDSNNYLKIYNMLGEYENEGLKYYYENYEAFIAEIDTLAGYLHGMLEDEAKVKALEIMVSAAGYPEYAEKIANLEADLAAVKSNLTAPNAAIDLTSANLGKLITALTDEDAVVTDEADYAYLLSETLTALDESQVMVQVVIVTSKDDATVTTEAMEKGTVLTEAVIKDLEDKVNEKIAELLNNQNKFYTITVNGSTLDSLIGTELNETVDIYYNCVPTVYFAVIDGEADQTVTIEDLEINLPKHPTAGWDYKYTIDGAEGITASTYTFTEEQLARLFNGGSYTVTRKAINTAEAKLVEFVAKLNEAVGGEKFTLVPENGVYTGITGNISAEDMMNFVMGLVDGGFSYVGLNNEGFFYLNAENSLEVSLQTLINAILKDNTFSDKTIVKLAEDGKGKVVTASMQLGNSAQELNYTDLTFTLNLSSVPEQLTNNVELLKKAFNYVKFNSNNGELDVNVTLPDQVYGAYAAVLIAVGEVDKADVADLNNRIAVEFLYDYIKAILDSEMDLETIYNTLDMLANRKLEQLKTYNHYFDAAVNYYNKWVEVNTEDDDSTTIDVKIDGKTAIDKLIAFAGINNPMLDSAIGMIKEHKDGETIDAKINASLTNKGADYLALIVDAQANGVTNKFEAPSSVKELQAQTSTLAGYSVVMLLNDVVVEDELIFSGTTVLDLNGKKVEGNIKSTGTLYIIDSSKGTYDAGHVTGAISGNVNIIGGKYDTDVKAHLYDGYYQHNGTVRNALYHIEYTKANVLARNSNQYDTINIVLNADVYKDEHVSGYLPNVKALAVDIATDLILNYALSAKLAVDGETLIDLQFNDLVGVLAGEDTAKNLINTLIGCINIGEETYEKNVGFEALVNRIIADLLDFEAVGAALENGTPLATYAVTTAPWKIELDHVEDGDYATVNVGSNKDLEKTVNVALTIQGAESVGKLISELGEIVEEANVLVDIPKPTYSDKTLTVSGAGKASVSVDMADGEYAKMLAVILAYGNDAKRAEVAAAINDGNVDALKPVIDKTSVKELFTALKVMNRNTNFAAMAKAVGVTVDVTSVAELEALYHLPLVAAGKALEKLNITGMDSKFGALYNEDSGYYELTKKDIFRDVEISRRGYTALVELEATELTLKVKLFNCMIGDVNHDNVIDTTDAGLIEQYLAEMNLPVFCFRGADVNGDDVVDTTDAGLMRQYLAEIIREFPAE